MKAAIPAACLIILAGSSLALARQAIQMTAPCQQSRADGRILVDGNFLPEEVRYRVLHYAPKRTEEGWTFGECRLTITRGASD
jgi:hypothetical protein